MTQDAWRDQLRGGNLVRDIHPDDWIQPGSRGGLAGLIQMLSWLAFPIAFVIFVGLVDRGYIFAKALGVLLPAWGAFTLASYELIPFSRLSVVFVLLFIALVSLICLWRNRSEMAAFVRLRYKTILIRRVLFPGVLWHRSRDPIRQPRTCGTNGLAAKSRWISRILMRWSSPVGSQRMIRGLPAAILTITISATVINAFAHALSGIVPEVAYNLALSDVLCALGDGRV